MAGELGSVLFLFTASAGGLLAPRRRPAPLFLLLGFGVEAALDSYTMREGEAPRHFARLRPAQLLLAVAGLLLGRERDRAAPRRRATARN